MMPEVDGFEVLAELKGDPELAALPVIMISALDDMANIVKCIEAGAEDYLTKPYDPVLLKARINACLDKRRVRDEERARLKAAATLAAAAEAIEAGTYEPHLLDVVVAVPNELGRLARVFQRMASQVVQRETQLRQEVQRLRVEIDEGRKAAQVAEVTETEYFQQLEQRAAQLRRRSRGPEAG
jgi:DNA-binding response OmpR family regulator